MRLAARGQLRYTPLRGGLPEAIAARAANAGLALTDLQQFVHQLVLHFEAALEIPGALRVLVVGRERSLAEIHWQAGEVDLAPRREVYAAPFALGDVVLVAIGPRQRERGGG